MTRIYFAILVGVCTHLTLGSSASAQPTLLGRWTFESGQELTDLQGNFPNVVLKGNASVGGGALDVNGGGTGASGWAVTEGGAYSGPAIVDKTLVSWVTMQSIQGNGPSPAWAGSAMTLDRTSGDHFDGIVFGERQTNRWMSGSSGFGRTQDFSPGFQETTTGQLIQMAFTYDDQDNAPGGTMTITGYRDGVQIGQYNTGNGSNWTTGDAEIFWGIRHGSTAGGPGALDALIEESQLWGGALTQEEIGDLTLFQDEPPPGGGGGGGGAVPEPASIAIWSLIGLALAGFGYFRCRRIIPRRYQ